MPRNAASSPKGVYEITVSAGAERVAVRRLATLSRRKHALSADACSGVSGGLRRVFTLPARGALAMTARAHLPANSAAGRDGSRMRKGWSMLRLAPRRRPHFDPTITHAR